MTVTDYSDSESIVWTTPTTKMDKCILLMVLLLLTDAVQYTSCDKINIIPSPDSPCPGRAAGELCLTLDQFNADSAFQSNSNLTLELHPGNHHMDSRLQVYSPVNFTMKAKTTASVLCSEQLQLIPDSYCFTFGQYLQYYLISDITFVGCTMNMYSGKYVTIERSSFINKHTKTPCPINTCYPAVLSYYGFVQTLVVKQCTFANNKEGYGGIYGVGANLIINGSIFENNNGRGIYHVGDSILILNSNFIGNAVATGQAGGAVYVIDSHGVTIANSYFSNNVAGDHSGAVYVEARLSGGQVNITNSYFNNNAIRNGSSYGTGGALTVSAVGGEVTITDSHFSDNAVHSSNASSPGGAAIFVKSAGAGVTITNCYFIGNVLGVAAGPSSAGYGGALYVPDGHAGVTITNSHFIDNVIASNGGHGGAVAVNDGNIAVVNTIFINNTANGGGGGAIYSGKSYTNISLTNNIFSNNTAVYCGVLDVDDFYHYNVSCTGNVFTYNRAVGQAARNNGGGVICIRNASIALLDNNFSHNSAAGDAGVLLVDESDVTVEGSIFSNNTAGGNGGVFHTYFYPTSYTITQTSFTNNQAGGDGGVMYVGRAGSQVRISQSTFGVNRATGRGGAIAIAGSSLYINTASIYENSAKLGGVVSACKSNIKISNPKIRTKPDPIYSFCTLYDSSNETIT